MQNIKNNQGSAGMYILIALIVILVVAGTGYTVLNYKKLFPPKLATQEQKTPEVVEVTKEDAQKYVEYYQSFQKLDLAMVQDIESLYAKNNAGKYIINQDKAKILAKINQSQTDIENLELPKINQEEIKKCLTSRKEYIKSIEDNLNTIESTNKIDENSFVVLRDFLKNCKELANKQIEAQVIIKGEK